MVKATKTVNYIREKRGLPPVKVDAEKSTEAQAFTEEYVANLNKKKGGTRRRLSTETVASDVANTSGCG